MGTFAALAAGVLAFGLTPEQSAAMATIGGADGPMVLFSSLMMAPELFVPISIIAYLYLSLTYGGYPYIIKLMVPKKYRGIDMYVEVPEVSQKSKFLFICATGLNPLKTQCLQRFRPVYFSLFPLLFPLPGENKGNFLFS